MATSLAQTTPVDFTVDPPNEVFAPDLGVEPHLPHSQKPTYGAPAGPPPRNGTSEYGSDDIMEKSVPAVEEHAPAGHPPPPNYDIGEPEHHPNPVFSKIGTFFHTRYFIILRDFALIGLLLGIWIPSVVRKQHRHKWVITTIISWFFIALILLHNSKYIPQRPFVRLISATWTTCIEKPWFKLPYYARLAFGWICLAALYFGTAFGIKATPESPYRPRGIAILGVFVNYCAFMAFSRNWRAVKASTTIVGLGLQMILGLLVYKTGAGYNLFNWISKALTDLLEQGQIGGAAFFWSLDFVLQNGFFFVNTLSSILWFVAFATMMFYIGALGWVIKKFAWLFYKLFGISGAEAVVAAATPFIGQGENCILTRPFVADFTESEFHQVLTSGFATISGSVFIAYVNLGMQGRDLLLSTMMSIPGSIAASKILMPETQHPRTLGRVVITRSYSEDDADDVPDDERSANTLHALSNGAAFGVRVVWLIWANVLCILSLVYTINGILAWIGEFWGMDRTGDYSLSLYLIGGYILYPYVWLLGVEGSDLIKVSRLVAHKIIANEFVAYKTLSEALKADPNYLSPHNLRICTLALCGFANLASMGISIGVMSAMAPKRADTIIRVTPSALLTGAAVTCMTAAIGGMINGH